MTKKAINFLEFNELSKEMQLHILHKDGVHVGKRKIDGKVVILFQLYSFYVEVYYKDYRKEVEHMLTSENPDILQPYLKQIHIRDLDKGKNKEGNVD